MKDRLIRVGRLLVDQERASILVQPRASFHLGQPVASSEPVAWSGM